MSASSQPVRPTPALVGYTLSWLALGAVVATVLIALLSDEPRRASLPPVQETELTSAAAKGGCVLRRGRRAFGPLVVDGGRAPAARPGVYRRAPAVDAEVAALRRGVIVLHYRPDLPTTQIRRLHAVQRAVPRGTILTPRHRMGYAVAATSWHRVLACVGLRPATVDAVRLFRGRYVGSGPDSP